MTQHTFATLFGNPTFPKRKDMFTDFPHFFFRVCKQKPHYFIQSRHSSPILHASIVLIFKLIFKPSLKITFNLIQAVLQLNGRLFNI